MRLNLLPLLAAGLLAAGSAQAHRMWLLPSTTVLSAPGEWVTIDAAVSNDLFYPDHVPLRLDGVQVWAPDGSAGKLQNPATGRYRSVFDVELDKPGTWKIGTVQQSMMGSFTAKGQQWRVGGRRGPPPGARPGGQPAGGAPGGRTPMPSVATVAEIPADATDVKLTEVLGRNEIFVTAGAPTKTVLTPTGKGLEVDYLTHPDELVSNEEARFRFLIDGKPAAGLKVTLVPGGKRFREAEDATEVTTGADGVAHVKWPVPGMFWMNATATDAHASDPKASERRMSYTATLEVPAP